MSSVIDDGLVKCKLQINNAKRVRHYWQSKNGICGCKTRIYINCTAICLTKLTEMLNDLGYSVSNTKEGMI